VDADQKSTTEIDPSSNRALLRKSTGVRVWKKKIHSGKEKMKNPLDNGRPR